MLRYFGYDPGYGVWSSEQAEEYTDEPNGSYDSTIDECNPGIVCDVDSPIEDYIDIGNGQYDEGEEYIDSNDNGQWDDEEILNDLNNDANELLDVLHKEINKLIRFFIQEKFYGLVELTRSIVWDSYETFISPTKRNQLSKYIIQVKVKDVERLKYLEVLYNPHEKKVDTNFEWDSRDEEFNLLNEQALAQKKIPNLFKLEISNQDDIPNINEFMVRSGTILQNEKCRRGR